MKIRSACCASDPKQVIRAVLQDSRRFGESKLELPRRLAVSIEDEEVNLSKYLLPTNEVPGVEVKVEGDKVVISIVNKKHSLNATYDSHQLKKARSQLGSVSEAELPMGEGEEVGAEQRLSCSQKTGHMVRLPNGNDVAATSLQEVPEAEEVEVGEKEINNNLLDNNLCSFTVTGRTAVLLLNASQHHRAGDSVRHGVECLAMQRAGGRHERLCRMSRTVHGMECLVIFHLGPLVLV